MKNKKNYLLICLFASLHIFALAQNVGVNTLTPEAALDINGDIRIRTAGILVNDGVTLALDVNTVRFSNYRVTGPAADFIIAGITSGVDGRLITLFNYSGFTMQLNNEDGTVAAANMIITGTNADIIIINKGIISLQYDGVEEKWIVKSSSKGGAAGGGGYWDLNGSDISTNTAGNVGIGTVNPVEKLTVETPNNSFGISHRSDQGIILSTQVGGTSAGIGTFSSTNMRLFSNGLSRVLIAEATGNVGIGTDDPVNKLTVETQNNNFGITHRSDQGIVLSTQIGGTSAGIGTFSPTNMRLFSNGLSRVLIAQATGNVGIGTDNPVDKLTVETENNNFGITHRSDQGVILSTRIGGTSAGIGTFSNTNMRIFANGISRIFVAEATGNVGIGTDNPTYKLSVLGNIRSTEVVVETGWADYVFDKKYKLRPLEEVEKFIQQNKHLPGIPSAAEIKMDGLQLGDTQKRMMEKIEELTLYIMQLNKRIAQLEKNNKN